jgi:hypothetical protein
MVKVLSRGGQDLGAVRRHLDYLRFRDDGEIDLETDDGQRLSGPTISKELLKDWDLDIQEHRRRSELDARRSRSPKLVHKLMLSMPAGTPPDKVLAAVKNFAREEFGLKHRYVMSLHTDEPHPHVHMVVKAVGEQGVRLHIRKATLREWRREFARHLRTLGVAANATERAVRGESRHSKSDGVYRAEKRGDSHRPQWRPDAAAGKLRKGDLEMEAGKTKLIRTREEVERGWRAVGDILASEGQSELAVDVRRFVDHMRLPMMDKEIIANDLHQRRRGNPTKNLSKTR